MRFQPAATRVNRSVLLLWSVLCALASIGLLLMMFPGLVRGR